MALFNKGKSVRELGTAERGDGMAGEQQVQQVAGQTDERGEKLNAYLGKGSSVTGKLAFSGAVAIDGRIEGEITAQETLVIGESAVVNAQISGNSVIVMGRVTGDIAARKRVEIRAPGRLFGNVTTPSLVIEEGVVFEGHCSMGAGEAERDRKVARFPRDEKLREKAGEPQAEVSRTQ